MTSNSVRFNGTILIRTPNPSTVAAQQQQTRQIVEASSLPDKCLYGLGSGLYVSNTLNDPAIEQEDRNVVKKLVDARIAASHLPDHNVFDLPSEQWMAYA